MEQSYCVLVPSEPRGSMGILSILVKDTRADQSGGREKRGLGGSTYWKHGQPTASTTAFFWSWLSFAVLLKFHKHRQPIFFLSSDPSSPRLLLLSSPKFLFVESLEASASLWYYYYYCPVSLGQRELVGSFFFKHTYTRTRKDVNLHQKSVYSTCPLCVPAVCCYCTYSSTHTVDSVLCNKQTDSLPTALLTLAIV